VESDGRTSSHLISWDMRLLGIDQTKTTEDAFIRDKGPALDGDLEMSYRESIQPPFRNPFPPSLTDGLWLTLVFLAGGAFFGYFFYTAVTEGYIFLSILFGLLMILSAFAVCAIPSSNWKERRDARRIREENARRIREEKIFIEVSVGLRRCHVEEHEEAIYTGDTYSLDTSTEYSSTSLFSWSTRVDSEDADQLDAVRAEWPMAVRDEIARCLRDEEANASGKN